MTYEFFIASKYRNKSKVLELTKKLRAKNKTVYCFIEADPTIKHFNQEVDAETAIREFEAIVDWWHSPLVKQVFDQGMQALRDSEKIILLLPAGKSAHLEAGIAYGLSKPVILIGEQQKTESLYLIFDEVYKDIDSFLSAVSN